MLEYAHIVYRTYKPTIPPEVSYSLTERGQDLIVVLDQIEAKASKWYAQEQGSVELAQEKYEMVHPHTHL